MHEIIINFQTDRNDWGYLLHLLHTRPHGGSNSKPHYLGAFSRKKPMRKLLSCKLSVMKDNIYAKVVAQPISFPGKIEVRYIPVDQSDEPTEEYFYGFGPENWSQVKNRYSIDDAYAETCEGIFRIGRAATIARGQRWDGKWPEPGDPDFGAKFVPEAAGR
jgi:hypothetical protein